MSTRHPKPRHPNRARPLGEALETRSMMTGGLGNTFAIVNGTIEEAGEPAEVAFTIDPAQFTLPRRALTLGIDVAAPKGSTLKPIIGEVTDPHDEVIPNAFRSVYKPQLPQEAVAAGLATGAMLTPISLFNHQPGRPATYTVSVNGAEDQTGLFVLGFYLPGDADGSGAVDQEDFKVIRSSMGSLVGDPNYNFNADANRDGRVGFIDLAVAKQNFGVKTTVMPSVSAVLDPATDSEAADRITNVQAVRFTGAATPGAAITFQEINKKFPDVAATAGADGKYTVTIPLALGVNQVRVLSTDAFGQTISGGLEPVVYTTGPVPRARAATT